MKKIFFLICCIVFAARAQNTVIISNAVSGANDTVTVFVSVSNTDTVSALQFDMQLSPEIQLAAAPAVTGTRNTTHTVSSAILPGNILRLLIYSAGGSIFRGSSGIVAGIKIKTGSEPGNYSLVPGNIILSNNHSAGVNAGFVQGNLTINTPKLFLPITSLNFGKIPRYNTTFKSIPITNQGNLPLTVYGISVAGTYFSVGSDTAFIINPGTQRTINCYFRSLVSGTYNSAVIIRSNDPVAPVKSLPVSGISFAVNQLLIGSISGRSGFSQELSVSLSNMQKVTGVQFDLLLPSFLSYQSGNARLSSRKQDHTLSVTTLSAGRIRCIVFSPGNKSLSDSSGELLKIELLFSGNNGMSGISVDSLIISDSLGNNISSGFTTGSASILSPDISGETTVNLGETPLTDSLFYNYTVTNTGSDTLIINGWYCNNQAFSVKTALPVKIPSMGNSQLRFGFLTPSRVAQSGIMQILSNDPDENPYPVSVTALAFAPNFMAVNDIIARPGDTVTVSIDMNNYDRIVAFQTDLAIPPGYRYLSESAQLTDRKTNHTLSVGTPVGGILRLFAFSMTGASFTGTTGSIVKLKLIAPMTAGFSSLVLTGGVLSDSVSSNVLKSVRNGTINLLTGINEISGKAVREAVTVYPNPVKNSATVRVQAEVQTKLEVNLFSLSGEAIGNLFSGEIAQGEHNFTFTRSGIKKGKLPAGTYLLVINANEKIIAKKIILSEE